MILHRPKLNIKIRFCNPKRKTIQLPLRYFRFFYIKKVIECTSICSKVISRFISNVQCLKNGLTRIYEKKIVLSSSTSHLFSNENMQKMHPIERTFMLSFIIHFYDVSINSRRMVTQLPSLINQIPIQKCPWLKQ